MLASREFLEGVGLMEECTSFTSRNSTGPCGARGKFDLAYARDSVIYHKEGASIGSHSDRRKRSVASDQYLSRSRVLFTKRFFPGRCHRCWHGPAWPPPTGCAEEMGSVRCPCSLRCGKD